MKRPTEKISDEKMESIMGLLLRSGVYISAAIVLFGGIVYLFQHGDRVPHYHTFRGEPSALRNFDQILSSAFHFHSEAIIQFGLLVLIGTPIARIVFSIIGFILKRDFLYVIFSIFVLTIIILGLVGWI